MGARAARGKRRTVDWVASVAFCVPGMRSADGPGSPDPCGPPVPSYSPGGPGKANTPEDFRSLMNDLETKVFGRFDDDTVVHPGHGDDTTLGTERPHLGEWWGRGW